MKHSIFTHLASGYATVLPTSTPMDALLTIKQAKSNREELYKCISAFVNTLSLYSWLECEAEITHKGIFLTPTANPHCLREFLETECSLVFSRQLNPDLTYSWVSELAGVPLTILANEVIDASGPFA